MSRATPRAAEGSRIGNWWAVILHVDCPLRFYVLALLIVEFILGAVLTLYRFGGQAAGVEVLRAIVIAMIAIFVGVVVLVTGLVVFCPEKLVFTAAQIIAVRNDEHLARSALRDSIRTLVRMELRSAGTRSSGKTPAREGARGVDPASAPVPGRSVRATGEVRP